MISRMIPMILIGIMILLLLDLITGFSITYWFQTRILRLPKNENYENTKRIKT